METLEQNKKYSLRLEWMGKRNGGYWLELINRATGKAKILMSQNKSTFDYTTIEMMVRWTDGMKWQAMYKKNII